MKTDDYNKTLITLIALTLSTCGFLAFFIVAHPTTSNRSRQQAEILDKFEPGTKPETKLLEQAPLKLLQLSQERVVSPTIGARSHSALYYHAFSGKVTEVDIESGKVTPVSERELPGFVSATWSPRKNEVIGLFAGNAGNERRYYSYVSGESAYLGVNIDSAVFSPNGSQIVYFEKGDGHGKIYISQPDGTEPKKILETRLEDLELFWPNEATIAFVAPDNDTPTFNLYFLTLGGELKKVLDYKPGLSVKWSRDGQKMLYSFTDKNNVTVLRLFDLATQEDVLMPVETIAAKCVLSIDVKHAICGVPMSTAVIDSDMGLSVSDDIYDINLTDGTKEALWTKQSDLQRISVKEIFLPPLEDYVVFVNGFDEHLYSIRK